MNSASLCSLEGRYDKPIPPRFLAPIDTLKISAQCKYTYQYRDGSHIDNFAEILIDLSAVFKFIGPSLWISLVHKTPSYITNMLQKVVVFEQTAFVKFKISNKF
jgi:hypothetical protein